MSEYVEEVVDDIPEETAEESARMQGWVPKDEFRGDPEIWKSAEEFNEYGDKHAAVAKERGKKASEDNKRLLNEMASLRSNMAEMIKFQKKQTGLAVDSAVKLALEKRDEAIEIGDVDAVHEHDKEIERLKEEAQTKDEPKDSEAFLEWAAESEWYGENDFLTAEADSGFLNPNGYKSEKAYFKELDRRIRLVHPEEFGEATNPRKTKQSAVATPKKTPSAPTKGRKFSDVPKEDQAMYKIQKEAMPDFTEEEFLSQYEWGE